jgi:hypothetical protein
MHGSVQRSAYIEGWTLLKAKQRALPQKQGHLGAR